MLDVTLVVVGGATESDKFPLELPTVLGRARDASIPLPHPLVSRRHCELFEREGRLFVRDLGSTNGTFVGSERISESVLDHGQLLTIGTVTFRAWFNGCPIPDPEFGTCADADADSWATSDDPTQHDSVETSTLLRTDTGHVRGVPRPHTTGHDARP